MKRIIVVCSVLLLLSFSVFAGGKGETTNNGLEVSQSLNFRIKDGTVRNLRNIEAIALPVFAQGVCDRIMGGNKLGNTKVNVVCSGVLCRNGDVAFADCDGIVIVEKEKVDEVLTFAKTIEDRKTRVIDQLISQ